MMKLASGSVSGGVTCVSRIDIFLRDNSNKTELYNFLADKIVKMCPNTSNTVIVTQEDGVVCNHSISLEGLTHCNLLKTVDASGHAFHVCHAVFSPLPWYADTTSQPLNA
jgi:hypothetical protein